MTDSIDRIDGGTLSSTPSLIFTDLSADYFKYEITFTALRSYGSGGDFWMDLSSDNGANFATSYSYQTQIANVDNSTVFHLGTSGSHMLLVSSIAPDANWTYAGTIEIFSPMDASSKTTVLTRAIGSNGADFGAINLCCTQHTTAQADNAFKFLTTGPTFSMQYVIYGYKL